MPRFTVIRGGRILSLPGHRGTPGDVLLDGDTIRAVGPPGLAAPPDAESIDARDRLLLPGLVNAHTHAHGALGKGGRGTAGHWSCSSTPIPRSTRSARWRTSVSARCSQQWR